MDATPEFDAKVAKISAPESHSPASDMIIPQLEAPEADDSEHEDPENVVEISSGNSSSYLSSDSSDLSEGTTTFIRQIDEKLQKATKSVPQKIELVNQPEPVAETIVPESVQVVNSEQTVTVTKSEPNQQQPEQPHQPSPNQTTISTPT